MAKGKGLVAATPVGMDDWQIEDDLRTLQRAEEIEKDPKRYARVKALARKKLKGLQKLTKDKD